jgi:hypothetical protein
MCLSHLFSNIAHVVENRRGTCTNRTVNPAVDKKVIAKNTLFHMLPLMIIAYSCTTDSESSSADFTWVAGIVYECTSINAQTSHQGIGS